MSIQLTKYLLNITYHKWEWCGVVSWCDQYRSYQCYNLEALTASLYCSAMDAKCSSMFVFKYINVKIIVLNV